MKGILVVLLLFPAVLLAQVGNDDSVMSTWIGSQQHELIRSWGAPDRVTSDGKGGKVLVYVQTYGSVRQSEPDCDTYYNSDLQPVTNCTPGRVIDDRYYAVRSFYVNPKGIIYYYRWEYK